MDAKGQLHPERWSVQYLGTACFVQVKGLRPGRSFAARVTAVPLVTGSTDLEVEVVRSPPSDTMLVATASCPPMGQPAPQLASRLKKELKVCAGWWCAWSGRLGYERRRAQAGHGYIPAAVAQPRVLLTLPARPQFKWAEPEESGGRPLEYEFEVRPATLPASPSPPYCALRPAPPSCSSRSVPCPPPRPQMSPPPEGWEGGPSGPEGFVRLYSGRERSFLARRLVPGVQYCGRVKAINCEVGRAGGRRVGWGQEARLLTQRGW